MKCYNCESDLIWQSDADFDEYFLDGEGIVSILDCPNQECGVIGVNVYTSCKPKNERDESNN